jgi:predicted amidophosphoribosyltransferase
MGKSMAHRDKTRCPQCGERVLPFAAGCAICGADLDTTRFDSGPSLLQRVGSWFSALSFGASLPPVVIALIAGFLIFYFLG